MSVMIFILVQELQKILYIYLEGEEILKENTFTFWISFYIASYLAPIEKLSFFFLYGQNSCEDDESQDNPEAEIGAFYSK